MLSGAYLVLCVTEHAWANLTLPICEMRINDYLYYRYLIYYNGFIIEISETL